ncbi:MAG TPA: anaerobic glycerol-3-phosphate dehydrogenase subunit GlpA, partial [Solirubrobacteraceae bacterium]|nr:anaerobic glycerol-3-phosphate dehydrogenase subunit GlpA [Solirubrobacteraceae bacterium]
MPQLQADVLVIGGGATGAGIAWDAALRGFDTILVERHDLATGTSGRFHGLLHSGGRYAVKDPDAARECVAENPVVRRVAAGSVEDTGGLFVTTPGDDPAYADAFAEGCRDTGIPCEEIAVAEALREEPRLNPGLVRAFRVQDASVDVWMLVGGLAHGAAEQGARILTYHAVTGLHRSGDVVTGARVRNHVTGDELDIEAGFTINASGAWAAQIAGMAGCEGVTVVPGKGIMIAMNHRLVHAVVNRCIRPSDGDIIVPIHTVSVIGTTDIHVPDPDALEVTQDEVDLMLDSGEQLVPGFRDARALRVWAGARPLFKDEKAGAGSDRDISRAHTLLDHLERDGVGRFLTITGGKLTTFRLMAQDTVDAMCRQLGDERPCTTAVTVLPEFRDGDSYHLGGRLRRRDAHLLDDQLICECELVQRRTLEDEMRRSGTTNLDDLRRSLRLGMGPCQGGFCMYRATGILQGVDALDGTEAIGSLRGFLQERWKGVWPIL